LCFRSISSVFVSPFDPENNKKIPEMQQQQLPSCYSIQKNIYKPQHVMKFSVPTLIYIFYNMPQDAFQLVASKEL
jgi:hypothetical protein